MTKIFPAIAIPGNNIDSKQYIENGTQGAMILAFFVAILISLVAIVFSYGTLLIVFICYPLLAGYLHKKSRALIHGSGVCVSEEQFPEIYNCVKIFKDRLNLPRDVDVYIVESNVVNAAAVRYGNQNIVLLTDDLIHGCLESGEPKALAYVIGHELAHISLKHTSLFRLWMANRLKKLGRLDEYSADNVALALVEDKEIAFHGLLLLSVGYALMPFVNPVSIIKQAQEVAMNKYSKKAERGQTHPLLLNRMAKVLKK